MSLSDATAYELNVLRAKFEQDWIKEQGTPPGVLYHYTGVRGLRGILEKKHFYAAHYLFLNDGKEMEHARAMIEGQIREKLQTAGHLLTLFLVDALRPFEDLQRFTSFVACFCEEGDLLSQWRAYGSYSLGLQTTPPMGTADAEGRPIDLRRVIYQRTKQQELITSIIDPLCDLFESATTGMSPPQAQSAITAFALALRSACAEFLPCFKDEGFREEKEWRAVRNVGWTPLGDGVMFREGRAGLIPYIPLDLRPNKGVFAERVPLCEVRCGPTQQRSAEQALRWMLDVEGYREPHTVASRSVIPFLG